MAINNMHDLAEMLSADHTVESIERNVYKYTDCGAWIDVKPEGIRLGSIVEGSDVGTCTYALDYPFEEAEYRAAEAAIEAEADAVWQWANTVRYYCGECNDWHSDEDDLPSEVEMKETDDGWTVVNCPKCGAGPIRGQTDADHGLDFPDIGWDYRNLKGWSSAL